MSSSPKDETAKQSITSAAFARDEKWNQLNCKIQSHSKWMASRTNCLQMQTTSPIGGLNNSTESVIQQEIQLFQKL